MIVEFIGCDGAGKTTLSRMLGEPGVLGGRAVAMADLILERPGLGWISHPTARNVAQEIGGLPFLVRAYGRRSAYLTFARRMHARYAPTTYDRVNGMRGIARRVGMFELARSRASDSIVLSDEGTVLSAYLFALTDVELDRSDVERFAELVPRPDRIVYVRASVASLVRRATARPDRRRQHAGRSPSVVERTIRRTTEIFDLVAQTEPLRDRVSVVENDDGDPDRVRGLVSELASDFRVTAAASDALAPVEARVTSDGLRLEPRG